jgi:hypothetical protein
MTSSEQIRLTEKEAKMLADFIRTAKNTGTIRVCASSENIDVMNEGGLIYRIPRKKNQTNN